MLQKEAKKSSALPEASSSAMDAHPEGIMSTMKTSGVLLQRSVATLGSENHPGRRGAQNCCLQVGLDAWESFEETYKDDQSHHHRRHVACYKGFPVLIHSTSAGSPRNASTG